MAIDKGNIKTSANYDVKAQKPLDGRAVRPAKADLIKKESWSSDGSTVYVYEGMQVYVQDEKKTYYLKDITKMFASDFSGWELMGTGAGSGITEEKEVYIGSDTPPKGTKVWIDPLGTPSSPSQPSADNGIRYYVLPEGVAQGKHQPGPYQGYSFTSEEAEEFKRVVADWNNHMYIVMLRIRIDGYNIPAIFNEVVWDNEHKDLRIWLGGTSEIQDLLNSDILSIQLLEDGRVEAS